LPIQCAYFPQLGYGAGHVALNCSLGGIKTLTHGCNNGLLGSVLAQQREDGAKRLVTSHDPRPTGRARWHQYQSITNLVRDVLFLELHALSPLMAAKETLAASKSMLHPNRHRSTQPTKRSTKVSV